MLTHRNLAAASHAYAAEVDPIAPGDAILHAAPMSHGSGLYIMPHVARLGVKSCRKAAASSRRKSSRCSTPGRALSMFAAPTMIKRLVDCPADCDAENIRTLIWGGAPMYVEDALAALDRFGPRLAQIYGQGEAPMTITTLSKQDIADRDHPRWRERLARPAGLMPASRSWSRTSDDRRCRRASRRDPLPRRASWPAIGKIRRRARRPCAAAGCTPATSAPSTPKAICTSRTAPRT